MRRCELKGSGNQWRTTPIANRASPRHKTCLKRCGRESPRRRRELNEKAIATPTMKTKKGNTRSVGVQPFQWACSRGQYEDEPSPGLFTRIIAAIVIPRNRSRDINLVV